MIRIALLALCMALLCAGPQVWAQGEAATAGSPLDRGRQLYFAGEYDAARALWEPLADAGNARALYNLATLYREGQGVAKDPERARILLRAAAEAGFSEAQYLLASFLFDAAGDNEAQRQEAVRLWLAAAAQGHASARYRLGLLYWNGETVARDLVRGHAWMTLAADDGLALADATLKTMAKHLTGSELRESSVLQAELLEQRSDRSPAPPRPAVTAARDEDRAREAPAAAAAPAAGESEAERRPADEAGADISTGWRLQIAAFRSASDAGAEWSRLQKRAPDLVAGLQHRVVSADLGDRGVFHRLQIGPFADRAAAESRCQALKAAGIGCFPKAPDN